MTRHVRYAAVRFARPIVLSRAIVVMLVTVAGLADPGPARSQALVDRDRWGLNDDWGIRPSLPLGATAFNRAQEAGLGWTRYWFYWNLTNPQPGVFDWQSSDREVNDMASQGVRIYADIMWAPRWAVHDTPGYEPWQCMTQQAPYVYVPTNPGCTDTRPDEAAFREYVRAVVGRYKDRVHYWGFWNEPNDQIFWHSAATQDQRLDDLVEHILIPGYEAAKSVDPSATIVGPEVYDPTALSIIMDRDQEYFTRTGHHFLDVISFHQYAGSVAELFSLIDRYDDVNGALRYRARRPVWITEGNARLAELPALYEGIEQRAWIDRFFYFGYKTLECQDKNADPMCRQWWNQGQPGENAMIDLVDTRLPAFFTVKSHITRYQGCYVDTDARALPDFLISSGATKESCIEAGRRAGYRYVGLQWYGQCWGGNTLGYGRMADGECNTPCSAAPSQACGGAYRNSIYRAANAPLYQGCYTDDWGRALPAYLMSANATVESCIAAARQAGYGLAGLQWYGQCWAGNDLGYEHAPDWECDTPCSANPGQTCGGAFRSSVWTVGR